MGALTGPQAIAALIVRNRLRAPLKGALTGATFAAAEKLRAPHGPLMLVGVGTLRAQSGPLLFS